MEVDSAIGDFAGQAIEGLRTETRKLAHALKGMAEGVPDAMHRRAEAFSAINQIVLRGEYKAPTPATIIEQRLVVSLGIARALAERAASFKPHDQGHWQAGGPYATGLTK